MECDICKHLDKKDNVCIACGMCFESLDYENTKGQSSSMFTPIQYMKYSITDPFKSFDAAIEKILVPLGLECYRAQVKSVVGEKSFKTRLSKEDKVIVTLLHVLRQHSFPILLPDLLKYTSATRSKILKAHRDAFGFQPRSEDYLKRTYERTKAYLSRMQIKTECTFEEYAECQKIHATSEPGALCLAFFLEHACVPQSSIQNSEYSINQIKSIRRKLRKG